MLRSGISMLTVLYCPMQFRKLKAMIGRSRQSLDIIGLAEVTWLIMTDPNAMIGLFAMTLKFTD